MRTSVFSAGVLILSAVSWSHAEPPQDPNQPACFRVNIQHDPVNTAHVEQNCDRNFSRTVQVGASNEASTVQRGGVNDNKVRQSQYDVSEYLGRIRSE